MKLLYLLFGLLVTNSEKIIKNINIPSCRNCIYFKPQTGSDFTSCLSKCEKFGEKNILTDEIKNYYADSCRNDEEKCGLQGKYFIEEKNIDIKILTHNIIYHLDKYIIVYSVVSFYFVIIYLQISFG